MMLFDTIAAISTPLGKGGVAVIRISGENAIRIASEVFEPISKKVSSLFEVESRYMCRGRIWRTFDSGERISIDDGMAVVFRAPSSFTGEDVVEINCHGGALVTQNVLSSIVEAGARVAEAGEFTRRAFVNGKMKLTEAEALGLLLEAETENQLLISRGGMRGILSGVTEEIYKRLVEVMGSIWAKIDFPDEDLGELDASEIREELSAILGDVLSLASTYKTGRAISEGIATAICGHTNVGKSSIYNRILGYDAAIVTDIEGTTRDVLREKVSFGGVTLRLSDTAGIRDTDDAVESIGIERAKAEISKCELIFAVFDLQSEISDEDKSFYRELIAQNKKVIALYNKVDAAQKENFEPCGFFDREIFVSAKTGEGFEDLVKAVGEMFIDGSISLYNDAVVMDARQYGSLIATSESLERAINAIAGGLSLDLCASDVEAAMTSLGELDGREVGEDIVANIFSRFCVGK